jgi:hypothetical protein
MTATFAQLCKLPFNSMPQASFRFPSDNVGLLALVVVFAWPVGAGAADEDPGPPPYHVEHVSSPSHAKNVTWPPKESVWPPESKKKTVKVERKEGKKKVVEEKEVEEWPTPEEHKKVHTFPDHVKAWTWPPFSPNGGSENGGGGWAPHLFKASWPPFHLLGYTWPPHDPNLTWYPEKTIDPPVKVKKGKKEEYPPSVDHRPAHSFPPHITDKTFPDHFKDVSWEDKKGPYEEPLARTAEPPSEKQPFTPPNDRSVAVLAGKPQLFVAGEVTADEPMLVTVRGPNSFEGIVVSAEANDQKVEAKADQHGHARLELSALGAGVATGTAILIRVTGNDGKAIAAAQTKLGPAVPAVAAPPEVPNLPPLLRNGDVVTMTGQNLGTQAQLVVGNQAQETLAVSRQELTAFVDAPATGPQPAYVSTPNGTSPTQTTTCFNFNITVPQTTIARGQHVTATASYEGLPPGSQIKFTNATPQVVSMKVAGATGQGVESVVTVRQPVGSVAVNMVGKNNGAFVIHYEVLPPPEMRSSQ